MYNILWISCMMSLRWWLINLYPLIKWTLQQVSKNVHFQQKMSCLMTKPTKWYVRPAKTQISLGIHPVWSVSSLCTQWIAKHPSFLHVDSEDSDQTGHLLIWVFTRRTSVNWLCHEVAHFLKISWILQHCENLSLAHGQHASFLARDFNLAWKTIHLYILTTSPITYSQRPPVTLGSASFTGETGFVTSSTWSQMISYSV